MNRIDSLKGFTVPQGYFLRITQEDGQVIEKKEGENSGGVYSFQQILEGANPDWELTEVNPQKTNYIPSFASPQVPITQKPEPSKEKKKVVSYPTPEVKDILEHVSDDFLAQIIATELGGDVSNLPSLTAEKIKANPNWKYSGYVSEEDAQEELNGLTFEVENMLRDTGSLQQSSFYAQVMFRKLSKRAQEVFGSNAGKFFEELLENAWNAEIQQPEVEEILPTTELPSFAGRQEVSLQELQEIQEKYKNPENIRRIFASFRNPHEEEIKQLENTLEEVLSEIKTETKGAPVKDVIRRSKILDETRSRLKKLRNESFVGNFRGSVSGHVTPSDLAEVLAETPSTYIKKGLKHDHMVGLRFGLGFFHEDLHPATKVALRKIPKSTKQRAFALGKDLICLSPYDGAGTAAHEFGHIIENNNSEVLSLSSISFLVGRVEMDEVSVSYQANLSKSYKKDEAGFEDRFKDLYMGKVYCEEIMNQHSDFSPDLHEGYTLLDYAEAGGIRSTELVAMGVQWMYENPNAFARQDPEYFNFIWSLRSRPKSVRRKK